MGVEERRRGVKREGESKTYKSKGDPLTVSVMLYRTVE
jgi:hypothetical protein